LQLRSLVFPDCYTMLKYVILVNIIYLFFNIFVYHNIMYIGRILIVKFEYSVRSVWGRKWGWLILNNSSMDSYRFGFILCLKHCSSYNLNFVKICDCHCQFTHMTVFFDKKKTSTYRYIVKNTGVPCEYRYR